MNMPGTQSSFRLEEEDKTCAYKPVIKEKVIHDTNDLRQWIVAQRLKTVFLIWDGVESHRGSKI